MIIQQKGQSSSPSSKSLIDIQDAVQLKLPPGTKTKIENSRVDAKLTSKTTFKLHEVANKESKLKDVQSRLPMENNSFSKTLTVIF